jgi:hypothetical protein
MVGSLTRENRAPGVGGLFLWYVPLVYVFPGAGEVRVERWARRKSIHNVMAASRSDRAERTAGGHPRRAPPSSVLTMRLDRATHFKSHARTLVVGGRRLRDALHRLGHDDVEGDAPISPHRACGAGEARVARNENADCRASIDRLWSSVDLPPSRRAGRIAPFCSRLFVTAGA